MSNGKFALLNNVLDEVHATVGELSDSYCCSEQVKNDILKIQEVEQKLAALKAALLAH